MGFGERLKSARLGAGMSLRELASRAGVSAQAISKYERGLDMPSSPVLLRLAGALGVSVGVLLRPGGVLLSSPSYRCRTSRLRVRDRQKVEAQVQDWAERYFTIEDILGVSQAFVPPSINRAIRKVEDVEKVARELRETWSLGEDPISNLTDVLEAQGIKVGAVSGVDGFNALTMWANETVPVIVVKADLPGDRQRFSLAHELGHLLLEAPESWSEKDIEKAAHRFAGAFLVPDDVVRRELGQRRACLDLHELQLLKHEYGISMQAWIHRALDLGVISKSAAVRLFRLFKAKGWSQQEPGKPYPPERTDRLERLVFRARAEGLIGHLRAAELLGLSLQGFEQKVQDGIGESVSLCA